MIDQFSIGALAKEVGVKVVTIRYYEQIGILPSPERTEGNYRSYTQTHAEKLRFIRRCRELGFPLEQIRDLFRLSSENAGTCQEVCAIADRHLASVESKLADLKRLASELRRITVSCSGSSPMAECRIIEAISRSS
jgi:DNA-binding transcriptional MerR regulator